MRRILIAVMLMIPLALLAAGCRRECDCSKECGSGALAGGTIAAAPVIAGNTAGLAAGATAAAGTTVAAGLTPPAVAAAPTSAPEKEYCASDSGDVFHRCSCTSVKRIKAGKLVSFPSREAVLASGRRPCKHCKP